MNITVDHAYQIVPSKLRSALQETLLCGTFGWFMTQYKDLGIEKVTTLLMGLRFSHFKTNVESVPLTGSLEIDGLTLDLGVEYFRLFRLWGALRMDLMNSRKNKTKDPYIFSPSLSRNRYNRKQFSKVLIKWVDQGVDYPLILNCGSSRPPHIQDAQLLYVLRGGSVKDFDLLESFLDATQIYKKIKDNPVKAVLFGGTSRFVKDHTIPSLRVYGIDVTKHYPLGKRTPVTLDSDTELVLILHEWVGHSGVAGKDVAIALARSTGTPWASISTKIALAVSTLKRAGFVAYEVLAGQEEQEAALEEQVQAGAELLVRNPDASDSEFNAWVEEVTTCPPLDDSVLSRAKALAPSLNLPEPSPVADLPPEPVTEPEPLADLPPEPVTEPEPLAEPEVPMQANPIALPEEDHLPRWQRWNEDRISVLDEMGSSFTWDSSPYRVALCPRIIRGGAINTDEGKVLVALWEEDNKILIARRDRSVHEAAKAYLQGIESNLPTPMEPMEPKPPKEVVPLELVPELVVETPEPPAAVEEHPYIRFERLRQELLGVMVCLGYETMTLTSDGGFDIKGKAVS